MSCPIIDDWLSWIACLPDASWWDVQLGSGRTTVVTFVCGEVYYPTALLSAYVNFYDQCGGGVETSFKGDKQGLGLAKHNIYHNKKRFDTQQMVVLLGSLAHNVVVWARQWLNSQMIQSYGLLHMVRDVFHVSGLLRFDASGSVVEIILNQQAGLARSFIRPLQTLLAPLRVVVNLGEI